MPVVHVLMGWQRCISISKMYCLVNNVSNYMWMLHGIGIAHNHTAKTILAKYFANTIVRDYPLLRKLM